MEALGSATARRIGRYDVVGLLATGGMAEILLARLEGPSGFERPVVLKRILPHLARLPDFVDMFVDEARIAAGIRHPNVVQVSELGREGDELFLVMEYLEGESLGGLLRRLLSEERRLDPALGAWILAEACAGLHAAHEMTDEDGYPRGVVHRDVSPQNVFITYQGQVKLLDFGIAKAADRSTVTEAGHVKGKYAYMSPEQAMGEELDRRSDLFAIGVVLFESLTGHRLFQRATAHLTFRAICDDPIPRCSDCADVPKALEEICARALSRDRESRHGSAAELRRELLAARRQLGGSETPEDELAAMMQGIFAERIEEKREMLRRFRSGVTPAHVPAAEIDGVVDLPSVVDERSIAKITRDISPTPAKRQRGVWLGVLALTTATVIALALSQPWQAGTVPAAASAARATIAASTASSAPAAPSGSTPALSEIVRVELRSTPEGATIRIGGEPRGTTPVTLQLARGSEPIAIELVRRGFHTRTERVVPDVDQRIVVPLSALPPPPTKAPREMPRFR